MMRTPLQAAAVSGDVEVLRRELAKGPDIDEYDVIGLTLLHDVCRGPAGSDRLACFHLLLEAGADPRKSTTSERWSPLLFAAEQAHTELCAALLASSAQADLNLGNTMGLTPLHCACRSRFPGAVECVGLLLSRGAAVNARDRSGSTPLDYAAAYRRSRLYPVLLRAGAALPTPGTRPWERTIGNSVSAYLIPVDQRKAAYIYLRKVAAAGGYRNYERNHLNALSATFAPKLSHLPPEMVRRVVEYAFHVGDY